jgi:hypothetical protein
LPPSFIGWSHPQLDLIFGFFDKIRTIQKVAEFRKADAAVFDQIRVSA